MAEYNKEFGNIEVLKNMKIMEGTPRRKPRRKIVVASGIAGVLLAGTVGIAAFQAAPRAEDTAEAVKTEEPRKTSPSRYYSFPAKTNEQEEDATEPVAKSEPEDTPEESVEEAEVEAQEPAPEPEPEPAPEVEEQPTPEPEPALEPAPVAEPQAQETVYEEVQQPQPETQSVVQTKMLDKSKMSLTDYVSQKASPSVVAVSASDGWLTEYGSGVIISADGLVITNYHLLLPNLPYITVTCEGKAYSAWVRGYSQDSDVALLKMELNGDVVAPIEIADSNGVQVGDWVMSMGVPKNVKQYTCGNVTRLGHSAVLVHQTGLRFNYQDLIGSSAWSTNGWSGGALLDEDGRLIAMNALIADGASGGDGWQESFAISSNLVSSIVNSILSQ